MRKEKIKFPLFANDIIVYVEISRDLRKKKTLQELIGDFSEVIG